MMDLLLAIRREVGFIRREFRRSRNPEVRKLTQAVKDGMRGRKPPKVSRRRKSVWAVTVVKDEVDIVELTVRNLIEQGVDHVIIADNGSTDGTYELLHKLSQELPITLLRDTLFDFHQGLKITYLARMAWRSGARWVLPFDADEFILAPDVTVAEALKASAHRVIDITIHNAYPRGGSLDHIAIDERPHDLTQCCFRAHPFVRVSDGNHRVNLPEEPGRGIFMIHLPWRSKSQLIAKVLKGKDSLENVSPNGDIDGHWAELAQADSDRIDRIWFSISTGELLEEDYAYQPRGALVEADLKKMDRWTLGAN